MYSSQSFHKFCNSANNAHIFTIDSSSNVTCTEYVTSGSNVRNRSSDGIYRTYYAANKISYYCCGGNSAIGHIFYNNGYANVFQIKNNGDASCTGSFTVKFPLSFENFRISENPKNLGPRFLGRFPKILLTFWSRFPKFYPQSRFFSPLR